MSSPTLTASRDFESQALANRKHTSPCLPGWTAYPQLPQADGQLPAFYQKHDCRLCEAPPATRPGGAYIMVLASAAVITALVIGLSFVTLQFRRTSRSHAQIDQARIYAELGIRHALHFTTTVPNWRGILSTGVWLNNISVGNAVYTVTGVGAGNGALINDPVTITAEATVEGVSRTVSVQIGTGLPDILRNAITAGADIILANDARVFGDIASNNDIEMDPNTWIIGNAQAVDAISETENITGTATPNAEPQPLPNSNDVVQYYISRGTAIPRTAVMTGIILDSSNNPFGPTNPMGIYYMNCAGQSIDISNCIIQATLVLLNVDGGSITGNLNWWSPNPNEPALIMTNTSEYLIGTDLGSFIDGFLYVDGDLRISHLVDIYGPLIVTGTVTLADAAYIYAEFDAYNFPPPPFHSPVPAIIPNSWTSVIPVPGAGGVPDPCNPQDPCLPQFP